MISESRLRSLHAVVGTVVSMARVHVSRLPWQRISKHRRPIAIAASVGLHVLLVFCVMPHNHAGFSTGGLGDTYTDEAGGLSLDLTAIALPDALALETREVEEEALDANETLNDLATTTADTLILSDAPSLTRSPIAPAPAHQSAAKAAQASAAQQGGQGPSGTSAGTGDDLWNAIAPCWRRLADLDTVSVNLTVTFASNGMLAKPPEIMRQAEDASNPAALRSESLAITALAECGAYEMAAGRELVSIHFPRP
jgi:hypothetical protein